jgi:hypothetical protein
MGWSPVRSGLLSRDVAQFLGSDLGDSAESRSSAMYAGLIPDSHWQMRLGVWLSYCIPPLSHVGHDICKRLDARATRDHPRLSRTSAGAPRNFHGWWGRILALVVSS